MAAKIDVLGLHRVDEYLRDADRQCAGAPARTVLGAALESVLDMLSNGVAILAMSVAARGPDDDHPYGHEKFETLGTLAIVCFLSITCSSCCANLLVAL